jgi:hypothetical protein
MLFFYNKIISSEIKTLKDKLNNFKQKLNQQLKINK